LLVTPLFLSNKFGILNKIGGKGNTCYLWGNQGKPTIEMANKILLAELEYGREKGVARRAVKSIKPEKDVVLPLKKAETQVVKSETKPIPTYNAQVINQPTNETLILLAKKMIEFIFK